MLHDNSCFCTLAGARYDGNAAGHGTLHHTPQWQVSGYPATATSATLKEFITNDPNETPFHEIKAQCLCPSTPTLFFGTTAPSAGTVTMFNGAGSVMTGANTLCMPGSFQVPGNGSTSFQLFDNGTNWTIYAPFNIANIVYRCIAYGPVIQTNVGGGPLTDPTGPNWSGNLGSASSGLSDITTNNILPGNAQAPVAPLDLYKTAWTSDANNAPFTYTLGGFAPSSTHTIRLHFAEWTKTGSNQRKFNIDINGSTAIAGLDIFARAGGRNKAWIEKLTNISADGQGKIRLQFSAITDKPVISGVEIQ